MKSLYHSRNTRLWYSDSDTVNRKKQMLDNSIASFLDAHFPVFAGAAAVLLLLLLVIVILRLKKRLYRRKRWRNVEEALAEVDQMEGHDFEYWCAGLLEDLGYEKVAVTPGSGDQGVDITAEKDEVRFAFQCKCYQSELGNTPVQEVFTGKTIYRCHVGVVITNSYFTKSAVAAAEATGILLWDRDRLADYIVEQCSI